MIRKLLVLFGMLALVTTVAAPTASAYDLTNKCNSDNRDQCSLIQQNNLTPGGRNQIWTIVSFALTVLGGLSVIMIVIGGLMYVISGGDSSKTSAAKNTIMYAVIGLAVAIFAGVIVTLVTGFFI